MYNSNSHEPEQLWDGLLSRDPPRVREAFASLDQSQRAAVLAHLKRMASSEPGWHPEQRASAQAALDALGPVSLPGT